MKNIDVSDYRREYTGLALDHVAENPFEQFNKWFEDIISTFETNSFYDANAMTLSTVNKKLEVSSRIVLLKEAKYDEGFIFYGNYSSKKGQSLDDCSKASLLFYCPPLNRQIRIEGTVQKISTLDSDKYFYSRPFLSQVSAIISEQSSVIPNRKFLEDKVEEFKNKVSTDSHFKIVRPLSWGGWILIPQKFEFWQGQASRLHDRIEYRLENNLWTNYRLAP